MVRRALRAVSVLACGCVAQRGCSMQHDAHQLRLQWCLGRCMRAVLGCSCACTAVPCKRARVRACVRAWVRGCVRVCV
eukprot:6937211-Alexandrium_andersonii.AAC.1